LLNVKNPNDHHMKDDSNVCVRKQQLSFERSDVYGKSFCLLISNLHWNSQNTGL